jgi:redox-sensitive bicupin YhaK (pirin superfamily)
MLDHFSIGSNAGFPDHPHRGQETITYLLSGSVNHEDFAGHKGTIGTIYSLPAASTLSRFIVY